MMNDKGEFFRVQAKVDGHRPAAGLETGEQRFIELGSVVLQEGDVVAGPNAQSGKGVGHAVGPDIELAVGQLFRPVDESRFVGQGAGGFGQQPT